MGYRLPAYVEDVPDYQVRDGRMFITMGDFSLAMPINVFLAGCARGEAAIAKWQLEELGKAENNVVALRP